MSGFSAAWLALREPHDLRARNREVLDALAASMAGRGSIAVLDLACGAGSTVRAISARLPFPQSWRLVDHDSALLDLVPPATPGQRLVTSTVDIANGIEEVLSQPADLVTTSALLDLVSEDWLDRLATQCAARGLAVYAALTYDGRVSFEPAEAFDAEIVEAVNRHQRRDKGFGPALGPTAGSVAIARFEALGWAVATGASDWVLGPEDEAVQTELLAGWAAAASEMGDLRPADIEVLARTPPPSCHAAPLVNPRRSRRLFRLADRRTLSAEVAIEQHLVVETMDPHRRRQGLLHPIDRSEREAGPAIAENDRRDDHMQAIDAARGDETRQSLRPALDQNSAKAKFGESGENCGGLDVSACSRQRNDLRAGK